MKRVRFDYFVPLFSLQWLHPFEGAASFGTRTYCTVPYSGVCSLFFLLLPFSASEFMSSLNEAEKIGKERKADGGGRWSRAGKKAKKGGGGGGYKDAKRGERVLRGDRGIYSHVYTM